MLKNENARTILACRYVPFKFVLSDMYLDLRADSCFIFSDSSHYPGNYFINNTFDQYIQNFHPLLADTAVLYAYEQYEHRTHAQ